MLNSEILDLIKWLLLIIALFIIGHRIGTTNKLLMDIKLLFMEGIMEDYKEEDDKTED